MRTYQLTRTFVDDTLACGTLRNAKVVHRTARHITIRLTDTDATELYGRAEHYVGEAGEYGGQGYGGLVASARTTMKRMTAQGYDVYDLVHRRRASRIGYMQHCRWYDYLDARGLPRR